MNDWTLVWWFVGIYLVVMFGVHLYYHFTPDPEPEIDFDNVGSIGVPRFPVKLPERQPWEDHPLARGAYVLPVVFMLALVEPGEFERLKTREPHGIAALAATVLDIGYTNPLSIVIDDHGKVCLEDGMHRLAVADIHSIRYVPVLVKRAENIRRYSRRMGDVFPLLWPAREAS